MAKRASKKSSGEGQQPAAAATTPRGAAIHALMALLAERTFGEISLADIAERATLSVAGLRSAYPGKLAILAGFYDRIDDVVLAGGAPEGDNERDRLFDVMMRRFDMLELYRPALRNLARSTVRDPALAAAVTLLSGRSMKWMLAVAHVGHGGILGRIETTGASMVFAEAMNAWLREDGASNEKTMAALDGALRRGERAMGYVRDACTFLATFSRRRHDDGDRDVEATV